MSSPLLRPYRPKARYVPLARKREESIQHQVCRYLRLQYPTAIFRTDFTAGRIPLTPNQGRQYAALQSGRAFPDIFIYEPRVVNGVQYAGLGLELKKDNTTIVVTRGPKKGHLTANPHIREQYFMLRELKKRGYYANFAVGFDQAKAIIDWYFGRAEQENGELF